MKVLKDPDDLFRAMNRKEREYQRAIDDASDVARAKAVGRATVILRRRIWKDLASTRTVRRG